jgi:hypothetical protein
LVLKVTDRFMRAPGSVRVPVGRPTGPGGSVPSPSAIRQPSRPGARQESSGEPTQGAERLVAERVGVRRVELGAVPDEREPLAQLPPDSEHGADAGDEQDQDPDRPNHLALEEQADAEAEQQPVDVVVGVVPPLERVVEVEGVAGDVDQERRRDEREPCPGQAPVVAATAGHQPPDDRWQEHRDRVGDQA